MESVISRVTFSDICAALRETDPEKNGDVVDALCEKNRRLMVALGTEAAEAEDDPSHLQHINTIVGCLAAVHKTEEAMWLEAMTR